MGTLIITISQGYKITVIHSLLFEKEVINVPLCCEWCVAMFEVWLISVTAANLRFFHNCSQTCNLIRYTNYGHKLKNNSRKVGNIIREPKAFKFVICVVLLHQVVFHNSFHCENFKSFDLLCDVPIFRCKMQISLPCMMATPLTLCGHASCKFPVVYRNVTKIP